MKNENHKINNTNNIVPIICLEENIYMPNIIKKIRIRGNITF